MRSMLKFFSSLTAIFFIITFVTGCAQNYRTVTAIEAQKIIATQKDYILLDVRTPEEYEKRRIPNAILLPLAEIKSGNVKATLPDKKQKILVYCWTGRRSEDASKMLADMGYSNVINIGGMVNWEGDVEGSEVN